MTRDSIGDAVLELIAVVNTKGLSWKIERNPGYDSGPEYYVTIKNPFQWPFKFETDNDNLTIAIRAAIAEFEKGKEPHDPG